MLELPTKPYEFENPPDCNWLPSLFELFWEEQSKDDLQVEADSNSPSPDEIKAACSELNLRWDEWEKDLRRIRAQKACETGICRNV